MMIPEALRRASESSRLGYTIRSASPVDADGYYRLFPKHTGTGYCRVNPFYEKR